MRLALAWVAAASVAMLVASGVLGGLHVVRQRPDGLGVDQAAQAELAGGQPVRDVLAALAAEGHDVRTDTDGDGLADALENFVYGSDPARFSTTGNGIPDGWLARHGYDPTRPGIETEPAALPDLASLPEAYGGQWPARYHWNLSAAYRHGMPAGHPANATWDNGVDPRDPDGPGGIPLAWLAYHGLSLTTDESQLVLNGRSTVLESFRHDTDPRVADGDADGLADQDEVVRYHTDPHLASTAGAGVPDGWLVRFGLDPLDRDLASRDLAGKGMTVRDTWEYNLRRLGRADALAGSGLDPTLTSQRGDGVPDGWMVAHGLDPLQAGAGGRQLACASKEPGVRDLAEGPAPGLAPIPELCLTVADAYAHGRPATWDEAEHGAWLGGLDPNATDQDGDGLPTVLEVRGWYLQRFLDVGPATAPTWGRVASDPLRADTDADGLGDLEEYLGRAVRGTVTTRFSPSDPGNADTAFSGIPDAAKVFGEPAGAPLDLFEPRPDGSRRALLDPARVDSAGSYLDDRRYLAHWEQASRHASACGRYQELYPGSLHERHGDWMNRLPWVQASGRVLDCAAQGDLLAPDGDADGDGTPNLADPDPATPDGVLVPAGWKLDPALLRFSDHPSVPGRSPIDPANPDTDGDRLPDDWELRHGRFVAGRPGPDIDPARWNSDPGQPLADGDQNLNGDVVRWSAYYPDGAALARHDCVYSFTNLEKMQAGADPHRRDEHGRGVTAGWAHFWGQSYPTLVQLTQPPAGDGVPADACTGDAGARLPDMRHADAVALRTLLNDGRSELGGREAGRLEYRRFEREQDGVPFQAPTPNPNQEALHARSAPIRLADGRTVVIDTIQGTYVHRLRDEAELGLNPYLADTDGDALPDAWEAYYTPGCDGALDAAAPDAGLDPDADTLSNLQEQQLANAFLFGTDPCLRDTRGDGMDDATVAALGNPVVPGSAIDGADGDGDADGDGEDDRSELQQGTDPRRPDTAFAGVLDYADLCLDLERLDAGNQPVPNERTRALLERGIAHAFLGDECPLGFPGVHGDQHILFYGSEGQARDASFQVTNPANAPVPDGWIVRSQRSPTQALTEPQRSAYACARPAWWDEARLGPWWWGVPVQSTSCGRDLDQDGLDDRNGEDPVPAASQSNRPRADPAAVRALLAAPGTDPDALLRLAQGSGECAGDPDTCRMAWQAAAPGLAARAVPAALSGLQAVRPGGAPLPDGELPKETPFTVSGRLTMDCGAPCSDAAGPLPLANRAIVVRMAAPVLGQAPDGPARLAYAADDGSVLGVGATGPDGRFEVTACLCRQAGSAQLPPGVTALGATASAEAPTVSWQPDAARTLVGAARHLVVHAYATPAASGAEPALLGPTPLADLPAAHPQRLDLPACGAQACRASQAATALLGGGRTVTTPTVQLQLQATDVVAWSAAERRVLLDGSLRDASGAPLPGRTVALGFQPRVAGAPASVASDAEGNLRREVLLPDGPAGAPALVGQLTIRAWWNGSATLPAAMAQPVSRTTLQAPLSLAIDEPGRFHVGKPATLTVRVTSQGQPVAGAPVLGSFGGVPVNGTTDPQGRAHIGLVLAGVPVGLQEVAMRVPATRQHEAAQATAQAEVVAGARLVATPPASVLAGGSLRLAGRLQTDADAPLPSARLQAFLGGHAIGLLRTDGQGRFDAALPVPVEVRPGPHQVRIEFAGLPGQVEPTAAERAISVQSGTALALAAGAAAPNGTAEARGRLTDLQGRPLAGQAVQVTGGGNATRTAVTGPDGRFAARLPVPALTPLGDWPVRADYAGSRNGTYAPSSASTAARLGSPTRIDLAPLPDLARGNNTLAGWLRQAADGRPLAGAAVSVAVGGATAVAHTDTDGRFEAPVPVGPRQPGGPVAVGLSYEGGAGNGPANVTALPMFRAPTRLAAALPAEAGRGVPLALEVRLLDDAGNPVEGEVAAALRDLQAAARSDADGDASPVLELPATLALGEATLVLRYAGDDAHRPAQAHRQVLVKDGARLTLTIPDARVEPGEAVSLRLHLADAAGRPMPNEVVAIRLEGLDAVLLARTGADGTATAPLSAPGQGVLRASAVFAGSTTLASAQAAADLVVQAPGPDAASPWLAVGAGILLLAAAAAMAYAVARRRRTWPLEQALRRTEARIRAGDPWAGAVLLAYRALGAHLERAGLPERPDHSVRDFVGLVVAATKVPEPVAVGFVQAVERARYAAGRLEPADAHAARSAVRAMLQAVRRAA